MAVLTLNTNPSTIHKVEASKVTPYTFDIAMQRKLNFITKEEIEARQLLFSKTPKEKAKLATAKAGHKVKDKKINNKTTSRMLTEHILGYDLSKLQFNIIRFNGIPLTA